MIHNLLGFIFIFTISPIFQTNRLICNFLLFDWFYRLQNVWRCIEDGVLCICLLLIRGICQLLIRGICQLLICGICLLPILSICLLPILSILGILVKNPESSFACYSCFLLLPYSCLNAAIDCSLSLFDLTFQLRSIKLNSLLQTLLLLTKERVFELQKFLTYLAFKYFLKLVHTIGSAF